MPPNGWTRSASVPSAVYGDWAGELVHLCRLLGIEAVLDR